MEKKLLLRFIFTAVIFIGFNSITYGQENTNTDCENALPACPDAEFGQDISSEVNSSPAPSADYYGCLASQPNPLWYYIQISESGPAMFDLTQYSEPNQQGDPLDVDFALWGPFDSPSACNDLSADNLVDSSYDPSGVEYIDFYQGSCGDEPTQNPQVVQAGDYYVLLITNFRGDPGYINLTPSSSNQAGFNCSILGETYTFCDVQGDGIEEVNLEDPDIINDITGGDPNVGVTFHATSDDAWDYSNVLNPNQTFTIGNDLVVYARRLDFMTNEISVVVVTFRLVDEPQLQDDTLSFCDNNGDGLELFDLTSADVILNTDNEYDLTYYTTLDDADNVTNPIADPDYYESGNAVIYVRAEAAECSSIAEITLEILETIVINNAEDAVCDTDGDGVATFNLNDYSATILGDAEGEIRYYVNESDAIAGNDNFITNLDEYETGTVILYPYVSGDDGCNATSTLTLTVHEAPILTNEEVAYDYCDNLGDGTETIDLTVAEGDIIEDTTGFDVYYFLNEQDAQTPNLNNAISNPESYTLTDSDNIYILVSNENCSDYIMVSYTLGDGVPVTNDTIRACNDGSGQATYDLTSATITSENNVTFAYYTSEEDAENNQNPIQNPDSYTTTVPSTVYVLVSTADCRSIAEITLDYFDDLDLTEVSATLCDIDSNGVEVFDLNDYVDQILGEQTGDIYFYLDEDDAINDANNYLTNIDSYETGTATLYVRVENGSCFDTTTLTLNVLETPEASDVATPYSYCDDYTDGVENIDITVVFADVVDDTTGLTAAYYLNETDAIYGNTDNAIADPTNFDLTGTTTVYVRVIAGDCSDVAEVTFELTEGISVTDDVLYTCVTDNGQGTYDLSTATIATASIITYHTTEADAISGNNPISNINTYTAAVPSTVYVHVEDGDCLNIAEIDLAFYDVPEINIPIEFAICSGYMASVDAGPQFASYAWSTGETTQTIEIDELGSYWVDLTDQNGCTFRHNFDVVPGIAPEIVNVEESMSSLTLTASGGEEPYEYSIGGFVYQSSNVFANLTPGTYNLYVKGADGCVSSVEIASVLDIPTIFTPNGDGINDVYRIPGLEVYPNSHIRVYDRYGALIYQNEVSTNVIWDGTDMSGNLVSTQDYWYILDISDGRRITGHVTVKNRTEKGHQ